VSDSLFDERAAEYKKLTGRLEWRKRPDESGRFLHVYIEHNNTCNLKCRMCGFSDPRVASLPRYHMPASMFESIARQIFPLTTYLHMSLMTEPFMTPDFPERLMLVRDLGVPYSLVVTNGTLLTDRKIEQVLDSQITSLAFSIDGGTRELYEEIRVGARFENVVQNIERFKEIRKRRGLTLPKLRINHVLQNRNIDRFESFIEFLISIGAEQVDVRTAQPMGFEIGRETKDAGFYAKVHRLRPLLADACHAHGIEDCGFMRDQSSVIDVLTSSGERMTCRRPWNTLAIYANGDVLPCATWTRPPLGNIGRESFEEIWNGEEAERLREEFERAKPGIDCQHCTIKQTQAAGEYDDFFFERMRSAPAWT
jgi:radical SAM protein with 4Fe4S-binding SPASM domain